MQGDWKPLPKSLEPLPSESVFSWGSRVASLYEYDFLTLLMERFNDEGYQYARDYFEYLNLQVEQATAVRMARIFSMTADQIQALTMQDTYARSTVKHLAHTGGIYNHLDCEDSLSLPLRSSWCPVCLLEDGLEGRDPYLRREWSFSFVTVCGLHNRPLAASCTNCAVRDAPIAWSHSGKGAELGCTGCGHPLAGQLRLENYSSMHSKDILNNETALLAWSNLNKLQDLLLNGLKARTNKNAKYQFAVFVLDFANLLTTSVDDTFGNQCLLDIFSSPYFQSLQSRQSKRKMVYPFPTMDLSNRRKALGLVSAFIQDTPELFTGEGTINLDFLSELALANMRSVMSKRQVAALDNILMQLPRFHSGVLKAV